MNQEPEFTRIDGEESSGLPSQSAALESAGEEATAYSSMPTQAEPTDGKKTKRKKKSNWIPFAIFMGIIVAIIAVAAIFSDGGTAPSAYYSEDWSSGTKNVEVIDIKGEIQASGDQYNQEFINQRINAAKYDTDNVGIVLRIASPGGTVYHSDMTYLKLMDYKEKTGRPIYVYCETQCASGGYYIAVTGDKIYANRNSTICSIGVISGQFIDATGLLEKLGVEVTTVHSGENKLMGSYYEAPTEEQIAIMQEISDEIYDRFVGLVADGRGMSEDAVRALADGRIYSAQQALDNGLIDEICTSTQFDKAVKKELGEDVTFRHYTYEKTWQDSLSDYFSSASKMLTNRSELAQNLAALESMTITEPQLLYMGGVTED